MPIKFVLESPVVAANDVPNAEETAAVVESVADIATGPEVSGKAGPNPQTTRDGLPRKDDMYTEAAGNPIVGYLGEVDPGCPVRLGALLYSMLNGRSYRWSEQTETVWTLYVVGAGLRYASFYIATMVAVVGAFTTPMLSGQYGLHRDDLYGDTLASTAWGLWILGAILLAWSRMSDREEGFPWYDVATMPAMLINDKLPENDDPDAQSMTWTLLFWNLSGVLVVTIASHTLLSQVYVNSSPYMDTLLLVWTAFEFVAALGDVVRVGSPYGLPRGWCRWLRMVRALLVVPVMLIFSVWVVLTAHVLY
jgi:hypothetical protein